MSSSLTLKADQWITKILARPGMDDDTITQKKINWISSIAVTSMIFCVTMVYHILFPQLKILIYYGFILTAIYLQGVIIPLFSYQIGVWHAFIDQSAVVIITFICILLLGGIPTSGGLIFVGLAQVFFSLNFREKRATIWIFIIYFITVVLAGVLHPRLTVPSEMTAEVNISLYVVNLLWISGFAMLFVMSFITQKIKIEHMETDRIRELDEAKTRLYTNITHEFRTPLTIITGMNDLIRSDPVKWLGEGSEKIDRNARILLNLVNQMLDLSRLESGRMPVRMIRADVNSYIRYIVELFQSMAALAKVSLNYTPAESSVIIDYEPEKLLHIISNLISNAIKFTQSHGRVEVSSALMDGSRFEIRVSDTGHGIPENHLPYIFDRFYRVEEHNGNATSGSGLGLSLTKEMVKLLGGTITAGSIYGEGTEFVIDLPVTTDAPLQEGPLLHEMKGRISAYLLSGTRNETHSRALTLRRNEKPMLLVVEDNYDVVFYLMSLLERDYDLIVAANGEEGVLKAVEYVPDIILSDVMMPVMDGITMLDSVKNDFRTSHIPVVLLTAKADIASRLEGLERGADAYITKPFEQEELRVQLRALISQRIKLQERYAGFGSPGFMEDKDFHYEDSFMRRVREIMLTNLADEGFDIHRLSNEMAMSRTQLYRKFRSLTNMAITEYMRYLRLQRAKQMLNETTLTVAETAYRTGFKNVSHFSRVFKREFGENPSTVRK
ncbi:MAG: ATP-binding protein [Bacteroidales bacterium]|jgi:signal transduction histidine kinase/DNA-binding response OmpR family regulator|nr:ATP-binding protein [Bacteroidales bacterium]